MMLTGLIGRPVSHSLGQAVYNRYFEASGTDAIYLSVDLAEENLARFISFSRSGFLGFNVTIPHKVAVMEFLDRLDQTASGVGAANLVKNDSGTLTGFNTDYLAFARTVSENSLGIKGSRIAVAGTGGVAMPVLHFIHSSGEQADVTIVSRDPEASKEKLQQHISGMNARIASWEEMKGSERFDLLINCTPLGMEPNRGEMPFSEDIVRKCEAGIDLVYTPPDTAFIRSLRKYGKKAVTGSKFFSYQGMESMRILFGKNLDEGLLGGIIRKVVGE